VGILIHIRTAGKSTFRKVKKCKLMEQSRPMSHLGDAAKKNKHLPFISPHLPHISSTLWLNGNHIVIMQ